MHGYTQSHYKIQELRRLQCSLRSLEPVEHGSSSLPLLALCRRFALDTSLGLDVCFAITLTASRSGSHQILRRVPFAAGRRASAATNAESIAVEAQVNVLVQLRIGRGRVQEPIADRALWALRL